MARYLRLRCIKVRRGRGERVVGCLATKQTKSIQRDVGKCRTKVVMSFRELRDATEILRSLGYPRLVSIENFRTPNFPLISEVLAWTVQKFDSNARLPRQLDNEADRVLFIKGVVLALLQKAHVRLNPKHLYQSDGHAIRELLPVLRMLYESVRERRHKGGGEGTAEGGGEAVHINALRSQVNAKRQQLHQTVKLAAELPKTGANLYELLKDEVFAKDVRTKALGRSLNAVQVEAELRDRIQTTEQHIDEVKERLQNIESDEQELSRKIERRKRELDQLQKRLAKLQAFRPPYLDEYERYEAQLRVRYAAYVTLFRNLHALQSQLALSEHTERERALEAEASMRVTVEKMRMESEQTAPVIAGIPLNIGERPVDGLEAMDTEGHGRQRPGGEVRVFGNMVGLGLSDDEDEDDDDGGRIIEMDDDQDEDDDDDLVDNFISKHSTSTADVANINKHGDLQKGGKTQAGGAGTHHGDTEDEAETEDGDDGEDNSGDNF
uniref:Clusterin-associated protein 1 n=1 Tax=Globodera rostochiensis TaxID=31243 RepID=A0A914H8Z4_GLORO